MTTDSHQTQDGPGLPVRALRALRENGIRSALTHTWRVVGHALCSVERSIWFCRDLTGEGAAACRELNSLTIAVDKDLSIVPWLQEQHATSPWVYLPQEIELMRTEKHPVIVAKSSDQIVGYIKIGVGAVYLHDFRTSFPLSPHTAIIYDTFVLPGHRNRGIASAMIAHSADLLAGRQYRDLWCYIDPSNVPSLKAYTRSGFNRTETIAAIRLPFGWTAGRSRARRLIAPDDQPDSDP